MCDPRGGAEESILRAPVWIAFRVLRRNGKRAEDDKEGKERLPAEAVGQSRSQFQVSGIVPHSNRLFQIGRAHV